MKSVSSVIMAAALAVGFSAVSAAEAATGNWNRTANGPVITQTNFFFDSSVMTPPVSVPFTATISGINWRANFSAFEPGLRTHIRTTIPNQRTLVGNLFGSSNALNGRTARQSMRFSFVVLGPTEVLSPALVGGGHSLNVNYQF